MLIGLVVRRVSFFLLMLVIFIPKFDTQETFSEAPICVFDVGREVTGPVPAPLKMSLVLRIKISIFLIWISMNLISQSRELSVSLLSKGSCTLICLFGVIQLELQILCWILLKAVTRYFCGRHLYRMRLRTDRPPLFIEVLFRRLFQSCWRMAAQKRFRFILGFAILCMLLCSRHENLGWS